MLYEKDYILRVIAEMGRMLRGMRDAATGEIRRAMMDAAIRSQCGLSLKAACSMEEDSLIALLPEEPRLRLSLLLAGWADMCGHDAPLQARSLRLMISLQDDAMAGTLAEKAYGLLKGSLDELRAEDVYACGQFLRRSSRYDLMDSAVFFLWETLPPSGKMAWHAPLSDLYNNLDDQALDACGMNRGEIAQSLRLMNTNGW